MRFLVFNITVIAALFYLFEAKQGGLSRVSEQVAQVTAQVKTLVTGAAPEQTETTSNAPLNTPNASTTPADGNARGKTNASHGGNAKPVKPAAAGADPDTPSPDASSVDDGAKTGAKTGTGSDVGSDTDSSAAHDVAAKANTASSSANSEMDNTANQAAEKDTATNGLKNSAEAGSATAESGQTSVDPEVTAEQTTAAGTRSKVGAAGSGNAQAGEQDISSSGRQTTDAKSPASPKRHPPGAPVATTRTRATSSSPRTARPWTLRRGVRPYVDWRRKWKRFSWRRDSSDAMPWPHVNHAASVLLSFTVLLALWAPWETRAPADRPAETQPSESARSRAEPPAKSDRKSEVRAPAAARLALPAPPKPQAGKGAADPVSAANPTTTAEPAAEISDQPTQSTVIDPIETPKPDVTQARIESEQTAAAEPATLGDGSTSRQPKSDAEVVEPLRTDEHTDDAADRPPSDAGETGSDATATERTAGKNGTATETVTVRARAGSQNAEAGGALLRLLEHGSGPDIAVAWPDDTGTRQGLHARMRRCFGLRTALMDARGKLWTVETPPGQSWRPDPRRYSGFVRRPEGYLARVERTTAQRIRAHHDLGRDARVVRLVPRHVDAALLAGLQRILGTGYKAVDRIRGRYALNGNRIAVADIRVDGRSVAGRLRLAGCQ